MKSVGTAYWNNPNTSATNESGFSALPGGYRNFDGSFYNYFGFNSFFWSASENDGRAWFRYLYSYNGIVDRNYYGKDFGMSVRCLRD
jgi:uncharacterized protein (TIGR02145 family)